MAYYAEAQIIFQSRERETWRKAVFVDDVAGANYYS
jgi:hypothetical protein